MKAVALIPARLAATRLPDKPLALIAGKPMIQHVWERARSASKIDEVFIATPDQAIADAVRAFGGSVLMTRADHQTGTDRLAEAAQQLAPDVKVIVNVQGDEPLIDPEIIDAAAEPLLADDGLTMSSLCCPLPTGREDDPNVVKVVLTQAGYALYFSRSPLPYRRNADAPGYQPLQHIGLYAYRRDFLETFPTLPRTPLEQIESLEQLRALEHGYRIKMVFTDRVPESVDTPDDLERVRALFAN
ncbi:3-deoxy-manno-octulosonate cytidylyltransferase [Armatimonas rosea]|uniref:3-deoxy-manno-octulosonate cytidylyltransferase n=1 Tax=Armatimonas rosea TaxID=685828 RepID=A0A7W9SVF2_ARMRO|nr:3-deoxy-manno-octulosonate cytidylyltransferase (CMP-KDO synthetase) [Armatimonas rosea]